MSYPILKVKQAKQRYNNFFRAKALFNFESTMDTELTISKGDYVNIEKKETDGWSLSHLVSNPKKRGNIPSNYLKFYPRAHVLKDFEAGNVSEMSVREGSLVVVEKEDKEWMVCHLFDNLNCKGLIPAKNIEMHDRFDVEVMGETKWRDFENLKLFSPSMFKCFHARDIEKWEYRHAKYENKAIYIQTLDKLVFGGCHYLKIFDASTGVLIHSLKLKFRFVYSLFCLNGSIIIFCAAQNMVIFDVEKLEVVDWIERPHSKYSRKGCNIGSIGRVCKLSEQWFLSRDRGQYFLVWNINWNDPILKLWNGFYSYLSDVCIPKKRAFKEMFLTAGGRDISRYYEEGDDHNIKLWHYRSAIENYDYFMQPILHCERYLVKTFKGHSKYIRKITTYISRSNEEILVSSSSNNYTEATKILLHKLSDGSLIQKLSVGENYRRIEGDPVMFFENGKYALTKVANFKGEERDRGCVFSFSLVLWDVDCLFRKFVLIQNIDGGNITFFRDKLTDSLRVCYCYPATACLAMIKGLKISQIEHNESDTLERANFLITNETELLVRDFKVIANLNVRICSNKTFYLL